MLNITENFKVLLINKFKELMLVTMEHCIESVECNTKVGELFALLSNEIGRELTTEEMGEISMKYDSWARNLVSPYNQQTKNANYDLILFDLQRIIKG
jgi:hypothetical protein